MDAEAFLEFVTSSHGITLKKSRTTHSYFRIGLFAYRTVGRVVVLVHDYGSRFYANLTEECHGAKMYGESLRQVTAETLLR